MDSWHSYPKVYNVGHPAVKDLFNEPVLVQEKVDGSQFSFGKRPDGQILVRSRGRQFPVEAPDNMFTKACEAVLAVADKLVPGYTYRGEYLNKPKHNVLVYSRVPVNNIILFDVTKSEHNYIEDPYYLREAAESLGFECVEGVYHTVVSLEGMRALMDEPSILGGAREGLVFKNYSRFTADGHAMMGKYVSEEFKEVHRSDWKENNPNQGDIIGLLKAQFCTPARWMKAVQHLQDDGTLLGEPKDIGPLVKECKRDFAEECEAEVKEVLWKWVKEKLCDQSIRGLPEWYRDHLARKQFEKED